MKFGFVFLFFIKIWATPSFLDLKLSIDPVNPYLNSRVELLSQSVFELNQAHILVAPQITYSLNETVDMGFNLTHRYEKPYGVIGHHVFYGKSQFAPFSLHQIGTGFDYLTRFFDIKTNYYHPLKRKTYWQDQKMQASRWVDLEGVLKLKYVNLAAGIFYDLDQRNLGVEEGIVIPLEHISLGMGIRHHPNQSNQFYISTILHLFKPAQKKRAHTPYPINRYLYHIEQKPFYSQGFVKPKKEASPSLDPIENILEMPLEVIEQTLEENFIEDNPVKLLIPDELENSSEAMTADPIPQERPWYDFFNN